MTFGISNIARTYLIQANIYRTNAVRTNVIISNVVAPLKWRRVGVNKRLLVHLRLIEENHTIIFFSFFTLKLFCANQHNKLVRLLLLFIYDLD